MWPTFPPHSVNELHLCSLTRCPWQLMIYLTCSRNKLIVMNYSGFQHHFSTHMAPSIHSPFIYKVLWKKKKKSSAAEAKAPTVKITFTRDKVFEWKINVHGKLQYWMCARTDQSQVYMVTNEPLKLHIFIIFRTVAEIKHLLHTTSKISYSMIAVGANILDITIY